MIAFRRPSPWAVALLLVGVIVFISAGRWQYDKAQYKRARESSWSDAQARAPVDVESALAGDANGFTRVVAGGTWLPQRYLLDNQVRNGRPGVEVFAPLRLSSLPSLYRAERGGLAASWRAETMLTAVPPARHLAYAWQWWFLAIAIVVVFAVVHRKRDSLS